MRKDRIEQRLADLGITQFEAGKRAGRSRTFIHDFLSGRKDEFKGNGPAEVAAALECSIEYLMGESDEVGLPPSSGRIDIGPAPSQSLPSMPLRDLIAGTIPAVGVIEEGVFRSPDAPINGPAWSVAPMVGIDVAAQIVFLVRGDAYSSHGLLDGAAVKCTRYDAASDVLRSGSWGVVRRQRGDTVETTLRELQYFQDRIVLRPLAKGAEIVEVSYQELGGVIDIVGVAHIIEIRCP